MILSDDFKCGVLEVSVSLRAAPSGCYGTLGLESGVVSDSQISASSEWEWGRHGDKSPVWAPSGARLKKTGRPWAAVNSDPRQWIQVDLKKEKKVTGKRERGGAERASE